VAKLGYLTANELMREVLWKELGSRHEANDDAEQRMVATLDRLGGCFPFAAGTQALFAVVDTLVKTFLTCVPEPPHDGLRSRWRALGTVMPRFIKSPGQAVVGDSLGAIKDLVAHGGVDALELPPHFGASWRMMDSAWPKRID
jgi:hypothetical protein